MTENPIYRTCILSYHSPTRQKIARIFIVEAALSSYRRVGQHYRLMAQAPLFIPRYKNVLKTVFSMCDSLREEKKCCAGSSVHSNGKNNEDRVLTSISFLSLHRKPHNVHPSRLISRAFEFHLLFDMIHRSDNHIILWVTHRSIECNV